MNNINVQTLKTNERTFFLIWLKIMQSFLKLGKQEQLVLASFLYYRYIISKEVKNEAIIADLTMSSNTRKQIKKDLKIKTASFNNTLSALRKKKMIIDDKLNNKIIPRVEPNFKNFKLVYNIEINETI